MELDEQTGWLPDQPGNAELRDPGLYPGFRLFISNRLTEYVRSAPGRINALVSAQYVFGRADIYRRYLESLPSAREVCLDSGAITPMLQVLHGKAERDVVHDWLDVGHDIILKQAWDIHDRGVALGVVSSLDLPSYPDMLDASGLTIYEAQSITLTNTQRMLEADVPPGWRKLFALQAHTVEDLNSALRDYDALGVLDSVRAGDAWLSVGGVAFENQAERVWSLYRGAREVLGEGHIHALGISRLPVLVPMIRKGWVQSADSSSPAQEVRYNRGPYRVNGPRPTFLADALFAASALLAEADLAHAIEHAQPMWEQGALV